MAHCLLETQPLITAVLLMNGTYSVEQEKKKKKKKKEIPLISLREEAQIDNDWQCWGIPWKQIALFISSFAGHFREKKTTLLMLK